MPPLTVGQTVWLKSGGAQMTIVSAGDNRRLHCNWFVAGEVKEDTFPEDALTTEQPGGNQPAISMG